VTIVATASEQQDRRMKIPQIMQLGVQEQFASAATVPFEVRREVKPRGNFRRGGVTLEPFG
jgi:hypothetical protein